MELNPLICIVLRTKIFFNVRDTIHTEDCFLLVCGKQLFFGLYCKVVLNDGHVSVRERGGCCLMRVFYYKSEFRKRGELVV